MKTNTNIMIRVSRLARGLNMREEVQKWIEKYSYKPSPYVILWLLARILKRRG